MPSLGRRPAPNSAGIRRRRRFARLPAPLRTQVTAGRGSGGWVAENCGVSTVLGCFRYPVKSAAREAVDRLTVTKDGVVGDRRWAVLDGDGMVVSATHPARGGRLLQVMASFEDRTGDVTVHAPGQPGFLACDASASGAVSDWLGHPVTLTDQVPERLRLHRLWPRERGMIPDWADMAQPGESAVTGVAGSRERRFVDYGAVHLVTTGALRRLQEQRAMPVQPLRFRPNLLLDLPEDPEPGQALHIGESTLRVDLPTPRCIVPSLGQPGADDPDPGVLRILARDHRRPVSGLGRAAVFGCYASVQEPGHIAVGDKVRRSAGST